MIYNSDGYYGCDSYRDSYSSSYDDCNDDESSHRWKLFGAAAALTCILAVLHFALFVIACIDTSKRNSQAKRPIMVVNGWGPMTQGWQPMQNAPGPETHQQQNQQQYQPLQPGTLSPSEHGPNIPLETRSPSPMMTSATHDAPVGESSRDVEQGHGAREYYGPNPGAAL